MITKCEMASCRPVNSEYSTGSANSITSYRSRFFSMNPMSERASCPRHGWGENQGCDPNIQSRVIRGRTTW